tara:strand:+ start:851 stop:1015 length:165 start_codon:yes stop_codon:yes gene_type:complete
MYKLIGKAPARSTRPGLGVTLLKSTDMGEIIRAMEFFSLHYEDLQVVTPKGVAK